MVNNSTTKRSVDLCVGLDVIIVGIMDAMAGTTAVAVDARTARYNFAKCLLYMICNFFRDF